MSYVPLGARTIKATADTTGQNKGNWTAAFTPAILSISTQIPFFEIFHIVITGGVPGATVTLFVDINEWDTTQIGWQNSWDPAQPLQLQQGQTLYFYWSDPTSDNTPPTVTVWMRYDTAIAGAALWDGPRLVLNLFTSPRLMA